MKPVLMMSTRKLAIAMTLVVVSYIVPIVTSFMIYVALIFHKKRTFHNSVAADVARNQELGTEAPIEARDHHLSLSATFSETEADCPSRNLPSFNNSAIQGDSN